MGRPRTPSKVLEARGAFAKNPQRRRDNEPEVREPLGSPPEGLSEAEGRAWHEIALYAPVGVLTQADRLTMELACTLIAEYRADRSGFAAQKYARLQSLLGSFGMTPSDRSKLSIEKPDSENRWSQFD